MIALFIALIFLLGCSSNKKIINDDRYIITKAPIWNPQFIPDSLNTGIKVEFYNPYSNNKNGIWAVPGNSSSGLPEAIMTLWKYPMDTVLIIKRDENHIGSYPNWEPVDLTTMYYEIKNQPLRVSSKVESNKPIFLNLEPGTYMFQFSCIGYISRYRKDVLVKNNYWSVVRIDTIQTPNILY